MKKEALLLIDIQNIYFTPGAMLLHKPVEAAKNAAKLLKKFRAENKTVIHIRHNFEVLSCIHKLVKPMDGEKIILKEKPSSFLGTDLLDYLREKEITDLVVAGMMSHMCVDTTVRACQDHGFKVTLIEDACTTMALKYHGKKMDAETVHAIYMASLNDGFAHVITTEDYL